LTSGEFRFSIITSVSYPIGFTHTLFRGSHTVGLALTDGEGVSTLVKNRLWLEHGIANEDVEEGYVEWMRRTGIKPFFRRAL